MEGGLGSEDHVEVVEEEDTAEVEAEEGGSEVTIEEGGVLLTRRLRFTLSSSSRPIITHLPSSSSSLTTLSSSSISLITRTHSSSSIITLCSSNIGGESMHLYNVCRMNAALNNYCLRVRAIRLLVHV